MNSSSRRVAVVAGGSAGVGRATARQLSKAGWTVAVIARGEERLKEAEAELAALGPGAAGYSCDVSEPEALREVARTIEAEQGPIGVWVNSAMLTSFSPFREVKPEEFAQIVGTTLLGTANGMRVALEVMQPRNRGRIVNVGSGLGYRSVPLQSAYCASKHGVVGLTASVRSELLHEGSAVTVSMVQLPAINTPQFDWARNRLEQRPQPAPPIYDPDVAAKAVMRAVRTGEREILVGKSVLQLTFGNMFFPDALDRKLADDAIEQQKSGDPEPGGRPDNITGPVGRQVAARGRFGDRAKGSGMIVGGTAARLGFLGAVVAVPLAIGVGIGMAVASLTRP